MNTCLDCTYFEVLQGTQGVCHRYPPVACVVMMPQQHAITRQVQMVPQSMAALPTVDVSAWCGEWLVAPPRLDLA